MSRSRSSKKSRPGLLGSHQKCWLWGRNAVVETLQAGRWIPLEIRLADQLPADRIQAAQQLADAANVPLVVEPAERLSQLCGSDEHQGYLAKMPPFPYEDAAGLLATRNERPLLLVLDGIQDAFNFGAMLRSAEVLGVDGVLLGEERQVEVTSHVARSSSGAVNFVRIARVPDLLAGIAEWRKAGLMIVGASEKGNRAPADYDFRAPTALVLGNEGTGLSPAVRDACDVLVGIPQSGQVNSLNAAVAAGILLYEAHRQRR